MKQTDGIISIDSGASSSLDEDEVDSASEWRHAIVAPNFHGWRLDRALVEVASEFSRSYLQQLIDAGAVALNGKSVQKASSKVKVGDEIALELRPTPQSQAFKPEPMALQVIFEDEHLLVINKPAGLVVHPAPGNWGGTLLNGLLAHSSAHAAVPRAGIVHRLDKDTSGLMVVARTRLMMDALVDAIAARKVSRQYLAIAHKPWIGGTTRSVDSAIGRDPRNRLRMAVVDLLKNAGKTARTDFVLQANGNDGCLVRCILHTGRTHQIRVHMASIGHPLVADNVYGGHSVGAMHRQALHACRLAFCHPATGQDMVFEANAPEDFRQLSVDFGLSYN